MPAIRIVSLGEVVPQDQLKALLAFAKLVKPDNPGQAMGALKDVLLGEGTKRDLSLFKIGEMSEEEFTKNMIARAKVATGKELTVEEFNTAWNAMNPNYAEFAPLLAQVLAEHRGEQKIVFISHTNPKDMRFLRGQLDLNHIEYTVDDADNLNSISGIPLYTTFATKSSKADLIGRLASNPTVLKETFFGKGAAAAAAAQMDIKYVRSVQGLEDPVLKSLDQDSADGVGLAVRAARVGTLIWDVKGNQPLSEALQTSKVYYFPTAKL